MIGRVTSLVLAAALLAACSGKHAHMFDGLPAGGACGDFDDDGIAQCAGGGGLYTCIYAGGDRAVCAHGSAPRLQHDTTVVPMPVIVPSSN